MRGVGCSEYVIEHAILCVELAAVAGLSMELRHGLHPFGRHPQITEPLILDRPECARIVVRGDTAPVHVQVCTDICREILVPANAIVGTAGPQIIQLLREAVEHGKVVTRELLRPTCDGSGVLMERFEESLFRRAE